MLHNIVLAIGVLMVYVACSGVWSLYREFRSVTSGDRRLWLKNWLRVRIALLVSGTALAGYQVGHLYSTHLRVAGFIP